jgi:hypothetical protein
MTEKAAKQAKRLPHFEPHQILVNDEGIAIVTDLNGVAWRIDAKSGTATLVNYRQ